MEEDIQKKIQEIREFRTEYNLPLLNMPIKEDEMNPFLEKYKSFFKTECDEDFINFLKICNGLEENGYQIYSSYDHSLSDVEYGIFQNNELWYEEYDFDNDFIFFAESGMDLFVFDKDNSQYKLLDRYSGDVYNEYKSFNEMLLYILKLMLNEEVE